MNPAKAVSLQPVPLPSSIWYRAVPAAFSKTPLGYQHSSTSASRFSSGAGSYPTLYFAPDPLTALLEVQALVRVMHAPNLRPILQPNSYVVFPVNLTLGAIVDFGDPSQHRNAGANVQELTGDWLSYPNLGSGGGIPVTRSNRQTAPTQELRDTLQKSFPVIEGFLSPSAKRPEVTNLVLFPDRVNIHAANIKNLQIESKQHPRVK